jgi:hypothetical protein
MTQLRDIVHGIDGAAIDGPGRPGRHCPVWWCVSLHDVRYDMHFGDTTSFLATIDAYTGRTSGELVDVGLDQITPGGEVMVSICSSQGTIWLTREEAKRLAARLVQLDIDAAAVPPAG